MAKIGIIEGDSISSIPDQLKNDVLALANELLKLELPEHINEKITDFINFIESEVNSLLTFGMKCKDAEDLKRLISPYQRKKIGRIEKKLNVKQIDEIPEQSLLDLILLNPKDTEKIGNSLKRCLNISHRGIITILHSILNKQISGKLLISLLPHVNNVSKSQLRIIFKICLEDIKNDLVALKHFMKKYKQIGDDEITQYLKLALRNKDTRFDDIEWILEYYGDGGIRSPQLVNDEHMRLIEKIERRDN